MADYSPVALLESAHDRGHFDCGEAALNTYLKQYALQNQKKGIVRNYVICRDSRIVAYYSLAYGSVAQTDAPAAIIKPRAGRLHSIRVTPGNRLTYSSTATLWSSRMKLSLSI